MSHSHRDSQELQLSTSSASEEYDEGSASSEDESSSESDSTSEEEEEPVLKYKRFAKEVVSIISEGPDGEKNIICCIAVHPKVTSLRGQDWGLYETSEVFCWCALFGPPAGLHVWICPRAV